MNWKKKSPNFVNIAKKVPSFGQFLDLRRTVLKWLSEHFPKQKSNGTYFSDFRQIFCAVPKNLADKTKDCFIVLISKIFRNFRMKRQIWRDIRKIMFYSTEPRGFELGRFLDERFCPRNVWPSILWTDIWVHLWLSLRSRLA